MATFLFLIVLSGSSSGSTASKARSAWLGLGLSSHTSPGIVYAAIGAPSGLEGWLWAAILGGILIFPDVAGFAIAGVRLDLKQAQDEIAGLRQDVNAQARATSTAAINIGDEAIAAATRILTRTATQAVSHQASGASRYR